MWLALDVGIHFVSLHNWYIDVTDFVIQQPGAMVASRLQDVKHCVFIQTGETCGCANAHCLGQHFNYLNRLVTVNSDSFERLRFTECFTTCGAAKTLNDAVCIFEMAKSFCWAIAAVAGCHLTFRGQDLNFACILKDTQL